MIRRIVLHNFMSHASTAIDLAAGLTVLIGDNNSGKSALVTALQVISQNLKGDFMVRHGEKECHVTVETYDPETNQVHEITWRRDRGKVSYEVDGVETGSRLRGKLPDNLHDYLQLALVETTRDPFDLHFGEQKKPIFLLGDAPSDRAAFFASSSDVYKLIEMQQLHRQKVKAARSRRNDLLSLQRQLNVRLDSLKPLNETKDQIAVLDCKQTSLREHTEKRNKLAALISRISTASMHVNAAMKQQSALAPLQRVPPISSTTTLTRLIERLTTNQQLHDRAIASVSVAASCNSPPLVHDDKPIRQTIRRLKKSQHESQMAQARCDGLAQLAPLPSIDPNALHKLTRLIEELQGIRTQSDELKKNLVNQTVRCEETAELIRQQLEATGDCPTCGQPLNAEQIIQRGTIGGMSLDRIQRDLNSSTISDQTAEVSSTQNHSPASVETAKVIEEREDYLTPSKVQRSLLPSEPGADDE